MPQKGIPTSRTNNLTGSTVTVNAPGRVIFFSEDPPTDLRMNTTGALSDPPRQKISTIDRMDSIGLTQWVGQDPYTMAVDVQIDGFPDRSVESDIRELEALGEVQPGRTEPPIIDVDGAVPKPHPNIRWRIVDFGTPQVLYLPSGDRCRYFTTVSLVQRVTDTVLVESLKATSQSKGLKARKTTVRQGEDWLYDVARRVYKDPSRAGDLAVANGLHLGKKLSPGLELRYP